MERTRHSDNSLASSPDDYYLLTALNLLVFLVMNQNVQRKIEKQRNMHKNYKKKKKTLHGKYKKKK